jgi:hypothetical protein
MRRTLVALFALPPVVIALACIYAALSASVGAGLVAVENLHYQALWYALFAYAAILVLALPAVLVAWRKAWVSWWHATVVGSVIGTLLLAPYFLPTLFDEELDLHYRLAYLWSLREFTLIGAMHGFVFWLLAFWRNRAAHVRQLENRRRSHERSSAA